MTDQQENSMPPSGPARAATVVTSDIRRFEIFVASGFCELELASITHTLTCANHVLCLTSAPAGQI